MKRVLLFIMFLFVSALGFAQLQVTLNVDSNPTPELSEWVNRNNLAILTVTNTSDRFIPQYRVKVSLLLDGDVKVTTDESVPYREAEFGTETFLADELIPYNALQFVDTRFRDKITRTGMLPPGSYSFCVELIDRDGRGLTEPQQICRPMIITDYQMPELLSPVDGQEFEPLLINSIMFKWTPLTPIPDAQTGINYLIAVSEVQPGQTPSQAFSVNYPIIEEEVRIGTQFTWPLDIEAPDEDQQYVWGIKPMTNEGNTYRAQNNGFVDYGVFTVKGANRENYDDDILENVPPDTKSSDSNLMNCVADNSLLDLVNFTPSKSSNTLIVNGLQSLRDAFWMQATGAIDPSKHELVTTINWGCSENISTPFQAFNSMSHDYSTPTHSPVEIPAHISINFELQPLTLDAVPCKVTLLIPVPDYFRLTYACENIDANKLDQYFMFAPMYPSNPHVVEILTLESLKLIYLKQVTGFASSYTYNTSNVSHNVDWGDSSIDNNLDHNYLNSVNYISNSNWSMPNEICITFGMGDDRACDVTICKELPKERLDLIEEFINSQSNTDDDNENTCACLNNDTVSIPDLTMEYTVNDDGDEHTLTIPDSPAALQSIMDCMASQEQFDGSENMDGHSEYNYQPDFFTGTVTHEWHIPDAMTDPSNTYMFTELGDDDQPLPEFVTVTFHIVNTNAGIDCYFTQDVPVPHDAYDAINGTEECDCDLVNPTEPELTLLRPDEVQEPREILFGGITAYRDYLVDCNSNYSLTTHSIDVNINWGENHAEESIVNAGPFTHLYDAEEHQIPTELCVTFTVTPLFSSSDGQACTTVKCLPVPEEWLALNAEAGTGILAVGDSVFSGVKENGIGEFTTVITSLTDPTSGPPYSGTGTTTIGWLKTEIHTEFTDITIDGNSNLVTGIITGQIHDTAPVYPLAWALGVTGGLTMTHPQTENILNWITNETGQEIDFDPVSGAIMPVKMPLGVNFDTGDQLAITEMVFRADKSEFNLIAAKATPAEWGPTQLVGFEAINIEHHVPAPIWPPERLELLEDIEIGNVNGKITFTFKSPTTSNPGCYMEWGSSGVSNYGIEVDANFTREWFIPVANDDGTTRTKANLIATGASWNGLILNGNFEESVIASTVPDALSGAPTNTGAHDFVILANNISYDWSDTINAPAMGFPTIYTGETTNLFHGFHMEQLTVQFAPNKMNTPTGGPIEVNITDMIIDDTGLTLDAEAINLIAFGGAEVADMVASVDRVYLEILSSNFVEAGVEGRIAIPVNEGNGLNNSLAYTALFNNPLDPALNTNFQIVLEPDQPIENDLFGGGLFTLDETSNLTGYFDKQKRTFVMDLNGNFEWEDATVGPVDQINMELGFEGLGFNYDSSLSTNKLTFDEGEWTFASPQKMIANFPVTIEEIEFVEMPTTGNQLMHGKLNFDVVFNLSSQIGGRSTLGIEGAISDTKASGGKTFDPELIGAVIDSISVSADMAAVKIDGAIGFRTNDPVYGNGFIGTLDAEFKVGGIKVGALAEFGNTAYNHTGLYRYWRVEADAIFPAPGITFLPGMAFRGFGGGAFKNMLATPSGSNFTFTPENDQLGFRANAVIATTPKEETFNADVGLLAAFSGSGGMTNIAFTGDFFVGATITDRSKAKIGGAVVVSYNFPDKKFILSANVNVNAPPITTPAPASLILDIDGKTNEWFFKFGEPNNLNTVNVSGVSLYEYLMFGNTIPYPGGFTNTFTNNYYSAVGNNPSAGTTANGGVGSNTASGKGFAMGIGFMFDKNGEYVITDFNNGAPKHVLNWDLAAGAELHLSYMQYVGSCGGYTPLGINGYRAKGGLGMYGTASAGVRRYKKDGSTKWNINLASIKAGAWITGEFPKPVYAAGAVEGQVGLFDDLLSFNFYQSFEYGTSCTNGGASSGATVTQGDAASEQQNALITYVKASPSHQFPLTQPVIAKFGLAPDVVFDVSEQQSNGTVVMRTFKMIKTQSLKIKNETTGAWEIVNVSQSQNNLGEHLYISQSSTVAVPAQLAPVPSFGGLAVAAPAASYVSSPAMGISGTTTAYPVIASNTYDNLPPEPDPVVNNLLDDRDYKFTVTATLKEYNGTTWSNALQNNGTPVTQTITKIFSTGPIGTATAGVATF